MRAYRSENPLRRLWLAAAAAVVALTLPAFGALRAGAADEGAVGRFPAPPAATVVSVTGTVVALADGYLALQEDGGAGPVAFPATEASVFTRGGYNAVLDELRPGDRVRMTIDPATGAVLRADVEPAAFALGAPSGELALLATVGLIGAGALLWTRLRWLAALERRRAQLPLAFGPAAPTLVPQRAPAAPSDRPRR